MGRHLKLQLSPLLGYGVFDGKILVLGVYLNADSRGKELARILKIIAGLQRPINFRAVFGPLLDVPLGRCFKKKPSDRARFRQQNGDNGHSGFSRLKLEWTLKGSTRMKKIFALFALALAFIGSAATVTTILALSA